MNHRQTCTRHVRVACLAHYVLLVLLAVVLRVPSQAAPVQIAYSFTRGSSGGIAIAAIDDQTGKILEQTILYESADCAQADKLRRSTDHQLLAVSNLAEDGPHLHLVPRNSAGEVKKIELPGPPDEFRIHQNYLLATCEGDWLAQVYLLSGQLENSWNAEDLLTPPGNGPQDIHVSPDGKHVVVSFQKDSKKGTKFGNRVAIFSFPEMQKIADLQLPRNRAELHIPENKQEQGPGPEVVLVARTADRLLVTLDLYGAVLIADWTEALQGRLTNMKVLPTSIDGSFGTAFPDRLVEMYFAGQPYVLVCNAGKVGGAVVVRLSSRQLVWKRDVPPGLETPVYVRSLHKAFSVCSGKIKQVAGGEVQKTWHPQPGVFIFDFSSSQAVKSEPVRQVATLFPMHRITAVPGERPLLLIAGGQSAPDQLVVLDPATEEVVDQQATIGTLMHFEGD